MPLLLQICAVIVTTALVAIAIVTIRTMNRFEKTADALNATAPALRETLAQVDQVVREARELLDAAEQTLRPVRRTMERLVAVGDRAASLGGAVLGEIEAPMHTAVALTRGLRKGTSFLLDRLVHRTDRRHPIQNGGSQHA